MSETESENPPPTLQADNDDEDYFGDLLQTGLAWEHIVYEGVVRTFFREVGLDHYSSLSKRVLGYALLIVPAALFLTLKAYELANDKFLDPPPALVDAEVEAIPTLASIGPPPKSKVVAKQAALQA